MKVRIGLIGAGAIAKDHCQQIQAHPDAVVAAVVDQSKERREEVRKAYGVARAYAAWEDLIDDPEIDAVVVALPNFLHAQVSLAAIAAGKHVLLEKPFAMNLGEARRVAAAAARKRRTVMVGMNQRYLPESQALRAIAARGELGDVYHAKAYWYRRQGSAIFGTWFVSKKLSGGGCMIDIGVHVLDLAMYLMDNWAPVSVSAAVYGKLCARGFGEGRWGKSDRDRKLKFDVDDFGVALIRFRNGATLELNASWALHREEAGRRNVELFGTKAGAQHLPLKIFRPANRTGEYEIVEPQGVALPDGPGNRQTDWIDAILGRSRPICTMEQALTVQAVLDAIYRSSETGREVRLRRT